MGRRKDGQSGFSTLELLIIIVMLAILSFAGWYVWDTRQNENAHRAPTMATQQTDTKSGSHTPVFSALPNGFSEYKNSAYGLRFGYPTEAGAMSATHMAEALVSMSTPETYNPQHNWDGGFSVSIFARSGFTFETAKYGATIKPESGQWVVVAVNPADSHKVGDVYAMPEKRINGGVAYEFTDNDEGYPSTRWLIELANGYAVIGLPRLITHDISTNDVTTTQRTAYTQLASDVFASFTKF